MKKAIFCIWALLVVSLTMACSPTPVGIKFEKETIILEGKGSKGKIVAFAVDADGNAIKEGVDLTFFCPKRDVVFVANDGTIEASSSGEATVEVEVVGTEIKKEIKVRVKIPGGIEVTHEKLRLWNGQVKTNVAAWVVSEKGAYVEGYLPDWSSDDPTVVSVKNIKDPSKGQMQRSFVEMKGLKSGNTTINATFQNMIKIITVRVYNDDEEVDLSGQRKPASGEAQDAPKKGKRKTKKKSKRKRKK